MFRDFFHFVGWLALGVVGLSAFAQLADDTVRVTVTLNPDGSKTVCQTDGANHQSTATTTGAEGKVRGRLFYKLDASGRYESGQVFAAKRRVAFQNKLSI